MTKAELIMTVKNPPSVGINVEVHLPLIFNASRASLEAADLRWGLVYDSKELRG